MNQGGLFTNDKRTLEGGGRQELLPNVTKGGGGSNFKQISRT